MNTWKLDDINFSQYGVGVISAKGVLDIPKTDIKTHDWLDEDGLDYNTVKPAKVLEREIVLHCFIQAGNYADFSAKVQAFYAAIAGPERELVCDYTDAILVHLAHEIHINRITSYQADKQVGTFRMRLTVMGDTQKSFMTVYKPDRTVRTTIGYFSDCKLHMYMMGENFLTGIFERNSMFICEEGDHITLATGDYVLMGSPDIKKESSNKFTSSMRFDARWRKLVDVQFRIGGTSETYYWGTMADMISQLIDNSNRAGFINISIRDLIPNTRLINHHISGQNCLEVLTDICEIYDLEYRFVKTSDADPYGYYLDISEKIGTDSGISLEYGAGKGLYSIDRSQVQDEEQVTVLFAEGSTKNLPLGYRDGAMRLQLPIATGGQLEQNVAIYGRKEKTKFFEDIFPELDSVITGYTFIDEANEVDQKQFIVTDTLFPVDLNETDANGDSKWLVSGTPAKLVFNSGPLAGFDFEIKRYDHDTKSFWLHQFVDEHGNRFPNNLTYPFAGNEYVIIDIRTPDVYVNNAESRVEIAGQEWLNEKNAPKVIYSGVVDSNYWWGPPNYVEPGNSAWIVDNDFNLMDNLRIAETIYDFAEAEISLRFSEYRALSTFQELKLKIQRFQKALESSGILNVATKRKSKMSVGTLRNKIYDPVDDKFNTDNFRRGSIGPREIDYDAGVPQITVINGLVEPNADGDVNKVRFGSGEFRLNNFDALTRYEIKKLQDSAQTYNPTRSWTLPSAEMTINTATGRHVYYKINTDPLSTTAEIILSESHIEVKSDIANNNLIFNVGYISDSSSPRTAEMLWGNVKMISPHVAIPHKRITNLTTHLQTITFPSPFPDVPVGDVQVYRMELVAPGKWRREPVLWGFTSADGPTATGFELEIDSSVQDFTGIIIQYWFI